MSEPVRQSTLRGILSQVKPDIALTIDPSNAVSKNPSWPRINRPTNWDSFTLMNLNQSYGHILNLEYPAETYGNYPRGQNFARTIVARVPADLHPQTEWNDNILKCTVNFAKGQLIPAITDIVEYVLPGAPGTAEYGPGMHVIKFADYSQTDLVVGMRRLTSQWDGRKVAGNALHGKPIYDTALWPLRQLANACDKAGTRYGYIQTNKDVVVCCFSKNADQTWNVALKAITRANSYHQDDLTTDLALWWLCMLAISGPENRRICAEQDMVPVDTWSVPFATGDRPVQRHHYSGFHKFA